MPPLRIRSSITRQALADAGIAMAHPKRLSARLATLDEPVEAYGRSLNFSTMVSTRYEVNAGCPCMGLRISSLI
jgi:hypothetical protein